MYDLNAEYAEKLGAIATEIQGHELLAQYLEEEEENFYNELKEAFEPRIYTLYKEVAAHHPLQLIKFEERLLGAEFEGMFLPKILGFSVLRGEVSDSRFKYVRPQDHFKNILLTICNSANFDILKKRIGQSIQIGFSLSSDIWVTNLINSISNKRVRHYLVGQKVDRYRNQENRIVGYKRYAQQFKTENYQSIVFPETPAQMTLEYNNLQKFILYRVDNQEDNSSLIAPMDAMIANKDLHGTKGHFLLSALYGAFMGLPEKSSTALKKHFNAARKVLAESDELLLNYLLELHARADVSLSPEADLRLATFVDTGIKDQLSDYFPIIETIHNEGYTLPKTQEAIKDVYYNHEGLSDFNEGIRRTVYQYFASFIRNLETPDYSEFFEITKLFNVYMALFGNQQFNQDLKMLSMAYVKKLLKVYVDKRGKDYQDIKKFVSTSFVEFKFLTEKEIVNLFKTRRKRKKTD